MKKGTKAIFVVLTIMVCCAAVISMPASAKITITHFGTHLWDPPKLREAQREAFYAKYGKDIEIQFQFEDWTTWWEKTTVMAQTGKLPDVIFGLWEIIQAGKKKMWDLEPFMKKSRVTFANMKPGTEESATYEGKVVAMPCTDSNWMSDNFSAVVYNKNLFEQSGVAYPKAQWSWEALYSLAVKLNRDTNGDGKTDILGTDAWQPTVWFSKTYGYCHASLLNGVLNAYGSRFLGVDPDYSKSIINSKESLSGFNMLQKLIDIEPNPGFYPNYWEGKVAMSFQGMTLGKDAIMMGANKFKSGVALLPNGPKGASYETSGIPAIDQPSGYFICSSSKEKAEAAWKWIHFLMFEKEAITGAKKTNTIPALYDKRNLKEWQDVLEPELVKSGYVEAVLDVQEVYEKNKTYMITPKLDGDMWGENAKILGKYYRGKTPLKQALEECHKKIEARLQKNKAAIEDARKERDKILAKMKQKKK